MRTSGLLLEELQLQQLLLLLLLLLLLKLLLLEALRGLVAVEAVEDGLRVVLGVERVGWGEGGRG